MLPALHRLVHECRGEPDGGGAQPLDVVEVSHDVYNKENPNGFNPDSSVNKNEPGQPTSGDVDTTVPTGTIFVMGDHRQGSY